MLYTLFLLLGTLTFSGDTLSEKTCDDMGWSDEIQTGGIGVEGVCGTKNDETVCGGEIMKGDAVTICTDMGARLCTQGEYEALEAFDSGCKYEKKKRYVWTSTACTQSGGDGSITVKLSQEGDATSECTIFSEKAYGGRCCADVGVLATDAPTVSPTVDPYDIDETLAELMCIAASTSKSECKAALPKEVGKCKYKRRPNVNDRCRLKDFYPAKRVLFVGNSFTYGPPDYTSPDLLNNLPTIFKDLAKSLGMRIEVGEDTIGGCTLDMHTPSKNPEECTDPSVCTPVNHKRVVEGGLQGCGVPATIPPTSYNHTYGWEMYHPCAQLIYRGPWDFVVLQDFSAMVTVPPAADVYMYPAIEDYAQFLKTNSPETKIVNYMTWSYYNGSLVSCPGGSKPGCFPYGIVDSFAPNCSTNVDVWQKTVSSMGPSVLENMACMTYNVAMGSMQALNHGADMVAPAGLGWEIARGGGKEFPSECKSIVDELYEGTPDLKTFPTDLPEFEDTSVIAGDDFGMRMFRDTGLITKGAKYCTNNCTIDHHPSMLGSYMNANVMYATMFGESTKGSAYTPPGVSMEDIELVQAITEELVLDNRDVWYPSE